MKFLIIGGGQDGLILSYLISNIEGVDGKLIIRKKNKFKKYYLNTEAIGSFTEQNIFSIIENIIDEYEPTHIINTAALSSTKECQKQPELAFNINTNFAIKLIKLSKSKKFKLIHLGSTLENQDRPNCIYTKSKKLVSNYILNSKNHNVVFFKLPNHESPLRDKRFFIRELINIFQKNIYIKEKIFLYLQDGSIKREWSWAPDLLNKLLIEIFSGKYENSFKDISTSLSLVEFGLITSKIFDIKEIQIKCEKLGYIDCEEYEIPLISENTSKWIKKLILTKDNQIYNLDKWCKLSYNLF